MKKGSLFIFFIFLLVVLPLSASADTLFTFATDAQTLPPNTVSGAITISASASVTQTTCLLVSSDSSTGQFSSSASSWISVSTVTMSKNTSNRTFYYKDSTEGSYAMTVKVAPKPDSVSTSCASWSEAPSNVQSTLTQAVIIGSAGSQTQTAATSSTQTQTGTPQPQTQAAGAGPPTLTVHITADSRSMAGGGSYFSAFAYGEENTLLPTARFIWNFGDGATAEGAKVFHVYAYPGRYAVFVTASYNYSAGIDRAIVEAVSAAVSLEAEGDGSLLIRNNSSKEITIGMWSLVDGGKTYAIPENTIVLAGEGVRFAASITGLGGTPTAMLLYPNGALAAAATVSADSPLRGERVTKKTIPIPAALKSAPQKTPSAARAVTPGEVLGTTAPTLPPESTGTSSSLWISLAALSVLLASGAGAVHYIGLPARRLGTLASSEEFDIEE